MGWMRWAFTIAPPAPARRSDDREAGADARARWRAALNEVIEWRWLQDRSVVEKQSRGVAPVDPGAAGVAVDIRGICHGDVGGISYGRDHAISNATRKIIARSPTTSMSACSRSMPSTSLMATRVTSR